MRSETITFELDKSKVLNANTKLHFMVHGKVVAYLRDLAAREGLALHPQEERAAVERRLEAIAEEQNWVLMKKRARAKRKKSSPDLSLKELNAQIEEEYAGERGAVLPGDIPVKFLFERFKVVITVSPPTRRRLDAPNLYPTVKALVDGFTDAALWEDDDFNHMDEMTFRYGEPTGEAGLFRLALTLEEVPA